MNDSRRLKSVFQFTNDQQPVVHEVSTSGQAEGMTEEIIQKVVLTIDFYMNSNVFSCLAPG